MRTNALKAKLKAGQQVVGALVTINDPDLVITGSLIVDAGRSFLQALRA